MSIESGMNILVLEVQTTYFLNWLSVLINNKILCNFENPWLLVPYIDSQSRYEIKPLLMQVMRWIYIVLWCFLIQPKNEIIIIIVHVCLYIYIYMLSPWLAADEDSIARAFICCMMNIYIYIYLVGWLVGFTA